MKKLILALGLILGVATAQAQFVKIEVEEVPSFGEYKTYRVYAVLKSNTDILDAAYALPEIPMKVESTAPFYQHPMGGALSRDIQRALLNTEPNLKYDSWVTIGFEDNYLNTLVPLTATKDSVLIVRDYREAFEEGKALEVVDGAWFVTPDQLQAKPDKQNRVLLMQLTTKGSITGVLNLHGRWHTVKEDGSLVPHAWEETGIRFTAG
ncbi:MAG: hypothetical protein AAF193_01985 [Bacteroidota bacterium]